MSNTVEMVSNPGTGYTIVTHVLPSLDRTGQGVAPAGPLQKFLKGEPKALGTVQITFGVVMLFFGIMITTCYVSALSLYSGVAIWGALIYISTGALSVAASNKLNRCLVGASLVMNVLNTVIAGIAIIIFSIDLVVYQRHLRDLAMGIIGVLLVLSTLQFCISISVSAFGCKAVWNNEPLVNINVVPNTGGSCAATPGSPPKESPPEYSPPETKGQMH